jgi:hypothetical protein
MTPNFNISTKNKYKVKSSNLVIYKINNSLILKQ